jgi:hypothetical protein
VSAEEAIRARTTDDTARTTAADSELPALGKAQRAFFAEFGQERFEELRSTGDSIRGCESSGFGRRHSKASRERTVQKSASVLLKYLALISGFPWNPLIS